jgi:hypothetical protein
MHFDFGITEVLHKEKENKSVFGFSSRPSVDEEDEDEYA